jgi:hypothetical protein
MTEYTLRPSWNDSFEDSKGDSQFFDHERFVIPTQNIDWNKMPKVTYQMVKNQIKSGDIIAFAGNSLKSKFLRIITNSPISHVGIALIIHGTMYLIHSNTDKGVCIDSLEKDFPFIWIQHNLTWTVDHFMKCIKVLPAGYDLKSIILTGILNTRLSKPQPIPLKKHFMCSDLVSFIWDIHQENLLPQQIVEWFMFQAQGRAYFVELDNNDELDFKDSEMEMEMVIDKLDVGTEKSKRKAVEGIKKKEVERHPKFKLAAVISRPSTSNTSTNSNTNAFSAQNTRRKVKYVKVWNSFKKT